MVEVEPLLEMLQLSDVVGSSRGETLARCDKSYKCTLVYVTSPCPAEREVFRQPCPDPRTQGGTRLPIEQLCFSARWKLAAHVHKFSV